MTDKTMPPVPRLRPGPVKPRLRSPDQGQAEQAIRQQLEQAILEAIFGLRIKPQPSPLPPPQGPFI